jgi:hypothetical protein
LTRRRAASAALWALLLASAGAAARAGDAVAAGPYDIRLFPTPRALAASGGARLVFAASPFGIAVTEDGRARYEVQVTAANLPPPSTLGPYSAYVAWAGAPDLSQWVRLGPITNGCTTVGTVELNKFLLVVSAESSTTAPAPTGPTVLHGTSPSGYLQSFLSHPLFRSVPQ